MNRYLLIVIGFSAMILAGCQSRPSSSAPPEAVIDKTTADAALSLGTALNHYAADHDGKYLEGKSSTEIFQKLIDGNYITDPAVLYVDLPGKVKAATKTLQPENVCWDVTSNVDRNSSDMLPVVFLTGYQINYSAGAKSMALPEPPAPGRTGGAAGCPRLARPLPWLIRVISRLCSRSILTVLSPISFPPILIPAIAFTINSPPTAYFHPDNYPWGRDGA